MLHIYSILTVSIKRSFSYFCCFKLPIVLIVFKFVIGVFGNVSLNPLVNQLFSQNKYLQGITNSLKGMGSALDKVIEVKHVCYNIINKLYC